MLVASENHPVCALGLLIYEVTRLLWGSTSKEGPVHSKSRAGVCRPHTQSLFQAVGSLLECSLNTWLSSHRNRTRSIPHRNRKSSETVESPHLLEIEQHFHLNDVKTIFLRLQDDICHTWSFSSQSPVQSIHYVTDPTFSSKRKPHHSRLQGLPLACGSLICLTAVEAPTAGRGSRQRMCEERKGTCKGGVNSPAIFSFLIVSLSARKICLNWGESIVHPADALLGEKRLSVGRRSAVIFGKSSNFARSPPYSLQGLEVSSVRTKVYFHVSTRQCRKVRRSAPEHDIGFGFALNVSDCCRFASTVVVGHLLTHSISSKLNVDKEGARANLPRPC